MREGEGKRERDQREREGERPEGERERERPVHTIRRLPNAALAEQRVRAAYFWARRK